jgi:hypothetical protein
MPVDVELALAEVQASPPASFTISFAPPPSLAFPLFSNAAPAQTHPPAAPEFGYAMLNPRPERLRSHAQFVRDFYAVATRENTPLNTIEATQHWLQEQPEFESLGHRQTLDAALRDAIGADDSEQPLVWPWRAVLAVSQLLEWGTIGNRISPDLTHAVQRATLQQRAALTRKPAAWRVLSKSAAAYALLVPFSWGSALFSAILPRAAQTAALLEEVAREGVDPAEVFEPSQVHFAHQLRSEKLNLARAAVAFARCFAWPLLIMLPFCTVFGADALLLGLLWGGAFMLGWLVFVGNRWVFGRIWQPELAKARAKTLPAVPLGDAKFFAALLVISSLISVGGYVADWSGTAAAVALFLLVSVSRNVLVAVGIAFCSMFICAVVTALMWESPGNPKVGFSMVIGLNLAALVMFAWQRQSKGDLGIVSLIRSRPAKLKLNLDGQSWTWWFCVMLVGVALRVIQAISHH